MLKAMEIKYMMVDLVNASTKGTGEAWMLIDGEHLGLGTLMRRIDEPKLSVQQSFGSTASGSDQAARGEDQIKGQDRKEDDPTGKNDDEADFFDLI